jgi:aryl-alcohol dehydrogenase-like predicted oxidoreductase
MSWLRPLGNTGLEVSALGLGTVKLGRNQGVKYPSGFELPDDRTAAALLDCARDLGINLLDTAPAYGCSEERLGHLLKGQRADWLLCTKVGEEFERGESRHDFSPEHTRYSVERSLKRLHCDVLDVVLVHSDGNDLDIIHRHGTLEALAELKQQGLLRAYGMSTKSVAGGLAAAECCDVVMVTYNPTQRDELPVLEACAGNGVGIMLKKIFASGHLDATQMDPVQASMDLAFSAPGLPCAVVGTLSAEHLQHNVASARAAVVA